VDPCRIADGGIVKSVTTVEGVEVRTGHWIGGERVDAADTFTDVSPIDEAPIAEVARGSGDDVAAAVAAAREGFDVWGSTAPKERAEILHAVADGVEHRVPQLAAVETRDNGSLLRSMRGSVMPRVARNFRFFADHLLTLDERRDYDGFDERFGWAPSGVTAVITPWNAPLMLATWRIAPALASGNAVVVKPPEWAPLTASLLADITRDAGLPSGVFNVVHGIGEEAGAALTADPGVDRIAFTGSVPTGKLVAAAAATNLTPASLELGGKSPFVAFADADLDAVVRQAVNQFDNAGQVCLAGTRLIVEASILDAFLERFIAATNEIVQGDPRAESTDIGPLITREHLERVDGFVQRAKADGAKVVLGGGPSEELGGLYYRPTVFADAPIGSEILTREVFGPVLTVQTFDEEDEAVALANDTEYGLSGSLWTRDLGRALRVSRAVETGALSVNSHSSVRYWTPFGGMKQSGLGRELGPDALLGFTDVKNVFIATD
jgi:aminomuconate-semialdehyde/2-hydroxymuconate-6-semialdehyde dehydrogenase